MLRPLATLALIALLVVPTAQAGWFNRDVVITTAVEHVGDRAAIQRTLQLPDAFENISAVYEVEGEARAIDRFGVERATVAYRIDLYDENGTFAHAARCHRLATGNDGVRYEPLQETSSEGASVSFDFPLLGGRTTTMTGATLAYFGAGCAKVGLQGRELREGDTLPLADLLMEEFPEEMRTSVSRPAVATTFHGREALEYRFDLLELLRAAGEPTPEGEEVSGTLSFVVADGLPGVALVEIVATEDKEQVNVREEMTAFSPGAGPATPQGSDELPTTSPTARFEAAGRDTLDLDALDLTFPYRDALQAVYDDPRTDLEGWLAQRPSARLVSALYTSEFEVEGPQGVGTHGDGVWLLFFSDDEVQRRYTVERTRGVETPAPLPLGPLASPVPVTQVTLHPDEEATFAPAAPTSRVRGSDLAALAAAHGVEPGTVESLAFQVDESGEEYLVVTQVPFLAEEDKDGLDLWVDLGAGAVVRIASRSVETTTTPGLLPIGPVDGSVDAPSQGAFSALARPETLAASAAATAAGIGLLVLLVKALLLPLYTRLRRDRLLDNPVRARLYERVRAEPGIHRAELVDFAGIGEGATRHHLAQLVAHKLLVELAPEGSGFTRYFAAGEVPPEVARREANLRAGSQRAVYELFAAEPQLSLREAAGRLGMSAPSVHRAKKKLEQAGLLPAAPESVPPTLAEA